MTAIIVYFTIFIVSAIPFFDAMYVIPIAIFGGAHLIWSFIFGLSGNIITLLITVLFSDKVRQWLVKDKESKRSKRAHSLIKKLGTLGYTMVAPLVVGTHITAAIGISLGIDKTRIMAYTTVSLILWSVALSALIYFGIDLLGLEHRQFLQQLVN